MKISLKNPTVYSDNGFSTHSFSICNNKIIPFCDSSEYTVYDCEGLFVFPGFVDVHVHLREPGFSYKETITTGTEAAIHGGYTTVCTMPNLNPVPDDMSSLKIQLDLIKENALCTVIPFASITKDEQGIELSDLSDMSDYVIGFSDDGKGVQNAEIMKTAMLIAKDHDKIISAHCEDNSLLHGGVIHQGEFALKNNIPGICSESEFGPIKRDIELAAETGVSYHVCHISTKESVELIREAKKNGVNITCETAPHYLLLNDSKLENLGRFKMNPPIRSEEDRLALVKGICDGTIDMIATDHAPHSAEEKNGGLLNSLMGVVGLETAFPIMYSYFVKTGIITLEKLIELMSINPKKRFKINDSGVNLCVYDLNKNYNVNPDEFYTKGRSTPFEGINVYGKCMMLINEGDVKFTDISVKQNNL